MHALTTKRHALSTLVLAIRSCLPKASPAETEITLSKLKNHPKNIHALAHQKTTSNRLLPMAAMMMAGLSCNTLAEEPVVTETSELPAVTVSADEIPQDGHRATTTRVGKVLQDPHDVPQAITTITRTLMDEQKANSLREALRNVSGLTFNAAEGGRSGDNMSLRGFYTFGDMYLDGIRDTAQYNREVFNLEQIDVLRGAAAMLFGRGQAGGVINQVSKVPLLMDQNKVTGALGTEDHQELKGDFNKRLGETTAARVNIMKRDQGSWRNNPETGTEPEIHREGIAASIATGLTTDNEYIFSHVFTKTEDIPDYGISFDNTTHRVNTNFPAEYFWGIGTNFDNSDTNVTTFTQTHRFKPGTELRTQLRQGDYERTYWAKTPSATLAPSAVGGTGGNQTRNADYETTTLQTDYSTKLDAMEMTHELLAGFEYLKEDSHRRGLLNLSTAVPATSAPLYLPGVENTAAAAVNFEGNTYAVYIQDTVEFIPQWKLTLGVRHDELDAEYSSLTSPQLSFDENSLRTSVSWHPADETHYYVSWSDSFSPTADLYQISGGALPAERSQVTELGAKWLLMDGNLAIRNAIYQAEKEWERNIDLESTAALLSRKRHTDGVEFEVAGRINAQWEIFGGLALMDAEIDEQYDGASLGTFADYTQGGTRDGGTGYGTGESADVTETVYDRRSQQVSEGQRPRNTPKHTVNIWTTYKFLPKWKAGLGLEAKGDRYGYGVGTCGTATKPTTGANAGKWVYNNCNTVFTPNIAPSYVRWDAMLAYERRKYTVSLNVQNLFDKLYYDALYDNGGFTTPGTDRKYIVTGEYKF